MRKQRAAWRGRVSKRSVNYRMSTEIAVSCATCVMYRPLERSCTLVRGDISALGLCDRWASLAESVDAGGAGG